MFALASLMGLLFSGCAKLGPDFTPPAPPPLPETYEGNATEPADLAAWWRRFDDPVLETLVQRAYAQNLDLQSAGLRILQARAALGVAEGLRYPQLQRLSAQAMSAYQGLHADTVGLNFDLAWELDLWGKYARGIESAQASLFASVASYRDILTSIVAEVARSYIAYRTAQERLAYARRNAAIQERVAQMTEIQFNSGNVSELDMQQARTQLYNTRANIPIFEQQAVAAMNALALLLGTTAQEVAPLLGNPLRNDDVARYIATGEGGHPQLREGGERALSVDLVPTAPFDIPHHLPASLLLRRPDLKVAEYQAHAAAAQIGVAEAALYPSFSLLGSLGYNATDVGLGWSTAAKNLSIAAGPGFSWNILQYGRLENQVRIRDAAFEAALVNYSKKVLQAVAEVENAWHGCRLAQAQLKEREKALEATVRAFNLSVIQYSEGLVSYQRLLSTVEKLTLTQDAYAQVKGLLATNEVLLYKALGGGWQMSDGRSYLPRKRREAMRRRVDWGGMLDDNATTMPEGWRLGR